jgi:hypothetical protein
MGFRGCRPTRPDPAFVAFVFFVVKRLWQIKVNLAVTEKDPHGGTEKRGQTP